MLIESISDLNRLLIKSEKAKRSLYSVTDASIEIETLAVRILFFTTNIRASKIA